jgi:hypothetical protein
MVADLRQGRKHENQLQVAVTQFSKFLVNKPLTAATKEDVRAFIFQSIRPRFSRYHDAGETGCAADSV